MIPGYMNMTKKDILEGYEFFKKNLAAYIENKRKEMYEADLKHEQETWFFPAKNRYEARARCVGREYVPTVAREDFLADVKSALGDLVYAAKMLEQDQFTISVNVELVKFLDKQEKWG